MAPVQALRGDGNHSASEVVVVLSGFGVRFFAFFSFPPPLPDVVDGPFFFTFVTLIASGVRGRGSSKLYAGNRDSSTGAGAVAPDGVAEHNPPPFPYPTDDASEGTETGVGACMAPSGISPALSITNVWVGGAAELRRLGRRAVSGTAVCTRSGIPTIGC